jgi:phosphate:Na+ symporter
VQTLLNLLASVALLVWGTHIVRTGILRVFGADLRRVLSKSVANRGSAFLAGLGVTSLVQSSSATALLASSFVSQNLIGLPAALAIMLGADVGTALLAQLFSLDLSWLSPLLIFFGVVFFLTRRDSRPGQLGRVAIGLGLMLLALQLVMAATHPITQAHGVRVIFATLSGDPMLDMLIGAAFVVVSFSSLAVVLLAATLASTNVVAVPVAFCLVLGANLGSGILSLVVNARAAGGGRRVAFGNLLFKVAGCMVFSVVLPYVLDFIARFETDTRRQVLHFHVLFNVALACGFLGFTDAIARFVERWLPVARDAVPQTAPRFLDPAAITTPALALANAARETLRIGDTIERMLDGMLEVIRANDASRVNEIIRLDDDVDTLYTAIKLYLTQISREQLDERDSRRWAEIISLTINLEHVGDILERIMLDLRDKKIAQRLSFSEAGMAEITEMHERLVVNLRLGLSVFLNGDLESAQRLLAEKERFRDLERAYHDTHLDRLAGQSMQSIETSSLHLDIISDMRRINSFFCSTAYPILEQAGKLRKSRLMGVGSTGIFPARPDLAPPATPPGNPPPGSLAGGTK